jgi:drug/metabolite transporter (DMT)-like permease
VQLRARNGSGAVAVQGCGLAHRLLGFRPRTHIRALAQRLFVLALVLYFALALVWVWILSFTPLSRAYLFVALAFALTPFAASLVFGEPLSARVLIGILVILFGLVLVSG